MTHNEIIQYVGSLDLIQLSELDGDWEWMGFRCSACGTLFFPSQCAEFYYPGRMGYAPLTGLDAPTHHEEFGCQCGGIDQEMYRKSFDMN